MPELKVLGIIPKQPSEKFPIFAGFSKRLDPDSDTINSVTSVTSRNKETGANTSGIILTGAPTIQGGRVLHTVQAGTDGEKHIVSFKILTSLGRNLEEDIQLDITEV